MHIISSSSIKMLKASITRKKHKTYIKIQTFRSKTVKIKLSKLNIKKRIKLNDKK